jgi:hypothetical protein
MRLIDSGFVVAVLRVEARTLLCGSDIYGQVETNNELYIGRCDQSVREFYDITAPCSRFSLSTLHYSKFEVTIFDSPHIV